MSRASNLAKAIGADGTLNVSDVAGLAAVASSGSASDLSTGTLPNARLATGAAVANLGYTPVNKAGDTMSGTLKTNSASASVTFDAASSTTFSNVLKGDTSNPGGRTLAVVSGDSGTDRTSIWLADSSSRALGAVDATSTSVDLWANSPGALSWRRGLYVNRSTDTKIHGVVNQPCVPAFKAMMQSGGGNLTIDSTTVFPYATEKFDNGGNYDNSTYRFTAPVTGYYFMAFSISYLRSATSGRRSAGLYVSGAIVEYIDFAPNADYDICELATVVYLSATDYVEVRKITAFTGDQVWAGAGGNSPVGSFRGYLIG